jgi:AcrR family transcriptional regulator
VKKKAQTPVTTSREKLILSAERLFSARGFDGVSVRDIANNAKVNSALLGYYFGGKKGLLAEVYARNCEPLKRERGRLLAQYRAEAKSLTLEAVLDAFIRPSLEANQGTDQGRSFSRLRAILLAENSLLLEQLVAENFDETSRTFVKALCECLPHLKREDVLWRFHFLLGGIYYTAVGPHRIHILSRGRCNPSDPGATREELIRFAAAGFRAPAKQKGPGNLKRAASRKSRPVADKQRSAILA